MALDPKKDPPPKEGETGNQPDPKLQRPSDGGPAGDDPPAKKARDGSIYADIGEPEPGEKGGAWADDWREKLATGDDGKVDQKQLDRLKRYSSPKAYHNAAEAAVARIRSGEYKRAAPPDPDNAEAMKVWREENGIPAAPTDYEVAAPGVDMTKLDEPTKKNLDLIASTFHKNNLTKAQAKEVTAAMVGIAQEQMVQMAQADAARRDECEDALRAELGKDYRPFIQMNNAVLDKYFGEDGDNIVFARTPDGRRLAEIPAFSKLLNLVAMAEGGDALIEGDSPAGRGVEGRIAEIDAIMNKDMNAYTNNPALVKEYEQLHEKLENRRLPR